MVQIVMMYVTIPSDDVAQQIVRDLLEKRLIACATMLPCASMYRWDGVIQNDQEVIVLAKTTKDLLTSAEQEIIKMHPYKISCILKIPVDANVLYAQWVDAEVSKIHE